MTSYCSWSRPGTLIDHCQVLLLITARYSYWSRSVTVLDHGRLLFLITARYCSWSQPGAVFLQSLLVRLSFNIGFVVDNSRWIVLLFSLSCTGHQTACVSWSQLLEVDHGQMIAQLLVCGRQWDDCHFWTPQLWTSATAGRPEERPAVCRRPPPLTSTLSTPTSASNDCRSTTYSGSSSSRPVSVRTSPYPSTPTCLLCLFSDVCYYAHTIP